MSTGGTNLQHGCTGMIEWFSMPNWPPCAAGAGIGLLVWTSFLLSDRPIGCSTAYSKTAGMVEAALAREKAAALSYYRKFPSTLDWQWMLVAGVIFGAFLSATLSGTFTPRSVPALFSSAFGSSIAVRFASALAGGILMGIGARWAGGCTSGHGISGTLQLSVASWVAVLCFFAGGILAAFLIYRFGFV